MCQLSHSEMPDAVMFGGFVVVLMSELKMEAKWGGFLCTALDQQEGSFT